MTIKYANICITNANKEQNHCGEVIQSLQYMQTSVLSAFLVFSNHRTQFIFLIKTWYMYRAVLCELNMRWAKIKHINWPCPNLDPFWHIKHQALKPQWMFIAI